VLRIAARCLLPALCMAMAFCEEKRNKRAHICFFITTLTLHYITPLGFQSIPHFGVIKDGFSESMDGSTLKGKPPRVLRNVW
jgi:hypothetical protein